ncbi:MAG: RNA-binding protein [Planctomycetota bacterium]
MNIYVGNLAEDVTEDDLRGVFEGFGEVQSVNIIKDRFSGESKGFGFVEMSSNDEAKAAIEGANGTELKGKALKVNEAHPRPAGGGGGGGGPRRGGGGGGGSGGPRRGGDRRGGGSSRGGPGGGGGGGGGGRRGGPSRY